MSSQAVSVPAPVSPCSYSTSVDSTSIPALSSSASTNMSETSSSSSMAPKTPQSPSIMAILDQSERKRISSHPSVSIDNREEPLEPTLGTRASSKLEMEATSGTPQTHRHPEDSTIHTPIRQGSFDSSVSIQRQPNVTHQMLWSDDPSRVGQSTDKIDSIAQNGLPVKRPVPASPLDHVPSDRSDASTSSQGRRMRPRLRTILSAPLSSSRQSSNTTIAKIAGAMSGLKMTRESGSSTPARHDAGQTSTSRSADSSKSTTVPTMSHLVQRSPPPTFRRGLTLPTPTPPQLTHLIATKVPPSRLDHFDRMLPKELKVMIMIELLDIGSEQERERRWSGEVGARRELIKLSRVSKSWRALCFDGQLWADLDLSPFAGYLHPRTLSDIFTHSAPFIQTLAFRGMDALTSSTLLSSLSTLSSDSTTPTIFTKLTTVDLRGCKSLTSDAIIAIVSNAPQLRDVNLKGVQAVNRDVLRYLAALNSLESVDVSRCPGIDLEDLYRFILRLNQNLAGHLKVLRFASLRPSATPRGSPDLLCLIFDKLSSLQCLDLQGCDSISNSLLINACDELRRKARISPIRHLTLSRCTLLRPEIFPAMTGLFPELRILELASIPRMFEGNSRLDRIVLNAFLSSLALLEKLDLDETCGAGGFDDGTLQILANASCLTHLNIGFAGRVSPEAMVQFIRNCTSLRVLEANNTLANGSVLREFQRCHPSEGKLSLTDCRAITAVEYLKVAGTSRPRDGFTGYAAIPMAYGTLDLQDLVTIKTFWSWRRVAIPKGWRETLKEKERELGQTDRDAISGVGAGGQKIVTKAGRGKGWRKKDDQYDAQGLCVVQ